MVKPRISVIIPTKNEEANLPKLLQSLRKQTLKNFEIIIVDNHSKDKTLKVARKYTRKIFTAGPERSSQRNFGAIKATGEFLLFVDADMKLAPRVIEQCWNLLTNDTKLSGVIIPEVGTNKGFWAKVKALEKRIYLGEETIEAARFFRKKDLEKIGGYDERLISGEDWDLSHRIKKLGQLGRTSAKIYHFENYSLLADIKKKYYYAKHISRYAEKHLYNFQTQSSIIKRFLILLKKPKLIFSHPVEFLGLIFLKSIQFLAFLATKVKS